MLSFDSTRHGGLNLGTKYLSVCIALGVPCLEDGFGWGGAKNPALPCSTENCIPAETIIMFGGLYSLVCPFPTTVLGKGSHVNT